MINVVKKSYNDSFLYNAEANRHNSALSDFILNSERIDDKKGPKFIGIAEDIKRIQRSNILYSLLMSDDVVLCMNKKEMPRAFKVFMAKDIRQGKGAPKKIFIDVTAIMTEKDGYYVCKNLQYLATYLSEALCYYLYEYETIKLLNNSAISISGAEAFSAMFCYVIDYMRIIGYEQSKQKIAYLAALYYLHNMLSKDLDKYTKNIAAKVAELNPSVIPAYDMYYEEDDFNNIDTFVTMIAKNFNLKGLTTEVFVAKWNFTYSPSALYACELFTSFAGVLCATYSGSYLVNQKQIERICANAMIKFATEILKLGKDNFKDSSYMTESCISTEAKVVKEAVLGRNKVPEDAKFSKEDYTTKAKVEERTKKLIEYYKSTAQEKKISTKLSVVVQTLSGMLGLKVMDKGEYENGSMKAVIKLGSKYFNDKDKRIMKNDLSKTLGGFESKMKKYRDENDKENAQKYSEAALEVKQTLSLL